MSTFTDTRAHLIEAQTEQESLVGALHGTRAQLAKVESGLRALRRSGRAVASDPEGSKLLEEQIDLQQEIATQAEALNAQNGVVSDLRKALLEQATLDALKGQVAELDDQTPFLLLPVRLETRFGQGANGQNELWVRIYPDDVAVETHEAALTEDEIEAGRVYWARALSPGGHFDEDGARGAWRALVDRYGAPRAAWIVKSMRPTDSLVPTPDQRQASWTLPPRVRVMPDRFVVLTYKDKGHPPTHVQVGNPIPDPLIVGPDPLQLSGRIVQDTEGRLTLEGPMQWLVDFDRAVEAGMGVRIPISQEEAQAQSGGFDQVFVLGLRLSSDAVDGQARFECLLDSHHHTDGLSLLPIGAPTKNTETARSGYNSSRSEEEASFDVEDVRKELKPFQPTNDPFARTDVQRLAEALGIRYETLQHIGASDQCDGAEARAMRAALWQATILYVIKEMLDPSIKDELLGSVRTFFVDYVSARGTLSTVRVGNQPYGILPITAFSKWRPTPDEHTQILILKELYNALKNMEATWAERLDAVPWAGAGKGDSDQVGTTLLSILGLHPTSVEFHSRLGLSEAHLWNLMRYLKQDALAQDWHAALSAEAQDMIQRLKDPDTKEDLFGPLTGISNVIFSPNQTALTGPLVDELPPSDTRKLDSLPERTTGNYIQWLLDSGLDPLRDRDFGTDKDGKPIAPPRALLFLMLRHSLALEYWDAAARILIAHNKLKPEDRREAPFLNLNAQPDSTRWDHLKLKVSGATTGDETLFEYLKQKGDQVPEAANLTEARSALRVLKSLSTARLERAFVEHLDLCSYRLDAWQLALPSLRLETLRNTAGGDPDKRRQGLYLGAYGWLENVRPAPQLQQVEQTEIPAGFESDSPIYYALDNGGYIHAPSLNHAAAAAVMRNAWLTHADEDNKRRMAVNLSSSRVRRALWYLEGIRNGQALAALLGYRFERGLHENHPNLELDEYIPLFRGKYSSAVGPEQVPSGGSIEVVVERNVVDGLKLLRTGGDYPYHNMEDVLPDKQSPKGQAIQAEVDTIRDDLDAIADLLMTESVYQAVQGNHERAGAAARAASRGARPPELEVVNTPRSGVGLTHRVMINLGMIKNAGPTPRSRVEPGLNVWLREMIGPQANIRCQVRYKETADGPEQGVWVSLQDLNLESIDFVYITGDDLGGENTELAHRILWAAAAPTKDPKVASAACRGIDFVGRDPAWQDDPKVRTFFEVLPLVRSLRAVITSARPLAADDFGLSSDRTAAAENPKGYDVDGLLRRAKTLQQSFSDALTDLGNLIDPPGDLGHLREALRQAAGFGIPNAIPPLVFSNELVVQARAALAEMTARSSKATEAWSSYDAAVTNKDPTETRVKHLVAVIQAILGKAFRVIPQFKLANAQGIQLAVEHHASILAPERPLQVDEWLHGLTRVRRNLAAYDAARMLAEMFGNSYEELTAIQLPYQETDRWLALPFSAGQGLQSSGDKLSIVMQLPPSAQPNFTHLQSGLLVDEWVEVIPTKEVTTGLTFHFNQPGSEPPQVLLLVVPPRVTSKWHWGDLVATLVETLELAKKRAVEPDKLGETPYGQLLPATVAPVTRHQTTISLDYAENLGRPLYE
jgi:hypothetical protein